MSAVRVVPIVGAATTGPCAKKRVACTIVAADGQRYVGTNDCVTPQSVCPRLPGEGYEKCASVCRQPGHAEVMALEAAGEAAHGSLAWIEGIGHVCCDCEAALDDAGVLAWALGAPPVARF